MHFELKKSNQYLTIDKSAGQVIRWQIKNPRQRFVDILYHSPNPKRTGIPILFPFANPLENGVLKYSGQQIPQHGFGRLSKWHFIRISHTQAKLKLTHTDLDKQWQEAYPFTFETYINLELKTKNRLIYSLEVNNLDSDRPLPIAPGIHPYFRLLHHQKKHLTSNLKPNLQSLIDWENFDTEFFWNFPKVAKFYFPDYSLKIYNNPKENTENLVVWSQSPEKEDSDFICLEPFTRKTNEINTNPIWVKKTWQTSWMIEVKFY